MRSPDSVQVELNLKLFRVSGTWKPNEAERLAAWELYVELVTRATLVPLEQGHLREALSSAYSVFERTRQILRTHGPALAEPRPPGQYNFGYLAIAYLNFTLRPLLAEWHPRLEDWEERRAPGVSRLAHEREWSEAGKLRQGLKDLSSDSRLFLGLLAAACSIPDLSAAVPSS